MAHDASDSDTWVDLSPDSSIRIGAYFPDSRAGRPETMTVFWKGELSFDIIRHIVRDTESLYEGASDLRVSLISYGEEREEVRSVSGSLVDWISPSVDAFRAEFSGSIGELTLWATLTPASHGDDGDTDENIGVCVSPAFFEERARDLIGLAIRETVEGTEQMADLLLGRLSDLIDQNFSPAVNEM